MPAVSIIVPVFKAEKYLESCVNSILQQAFYDLEVILVDDGSPDQCPEICDRFAKNDPRVMVIHKENGGVSRARNTGLYNSRGKYVIFCDADDWFEGDAVSRLYEEAERSQADVVVGDVNLIRQEDSKRAAFFRDEFEIGCDDDRTGLLRADLYRTYCPDPSDDGPAFGYGGPWNKLVRRELLLKNRIEFDASLRGIFDDILYTAYIYATARRIIYRHISVYNYRLSEGTITHSYRSDVLEVNRAIFRAWKRFFKRFQNYDALQCAFYAMVIRRIEDSIQSFYLHKQCSLSVKDRKNMFAEMISGCPYSSAIRKVKIRKLSRKQGAAVLLCRMGLGKYVLTLYRYSDR